MFAYLRKLLKKKKKTTHDNFLNTESLLNISYKHTHKNPQQNMRQTKSSNNTKNYHHGQVGLIPGM